ncbi:MAG: alanine--tRNA ligase [Dehalococcoidia bacterium]|nr:alanine--tRNA ligase [Dehalococcoidia bacterium]
MLTGNDIRTTFLQFFEGKGHRVISSSSLIPHSDPTLLLTTAGMVQLKPYLLGQAIPPAKRLASVQKCFRTTDIESVGDVSHLTFFEMLGNFSIGDYFKNEVIAWAWELVTECFRVPRERLWITVYLDDDEAFALWRDVIGVPKTKIIRLGEADNFWGPAGETGPCGPCSEMHYDFGEDAGCGKADCNPACKCGRFCEIWNLVFMQYYQDQDGHRTPLPKPNIDTGMGLERLAAILQGVKSVYQTDLFQPLLKHAAQIFAQTYGQDEEADRALRVVTEHGRAIPFLIADGVLPSNDGRGYVLRRLLRRAALFGRRLGQREVFLADMAEATIRQFSPIYPELSTREAFVLEVIRREETRFNETLSTGLSLLDEIIGSPESQSHIIPGATVFRLYDTYGFPVELTCEVAAAHGLLVDTDGFHAEMTKQRTRAREAHRFGGGEPVTAIANFVPTIFVGYAELSQETTVAGIITEGDCATQASEGDEVGLVLTDTPFYAEMGGQVGDTGKISAGGSVFTVTNTVKLSPVITMHQGLVTTGGFAVGDQVVAEVDVARREDIARNHTATHLVQFALRKVLGEHVQQRGSLVAPERLRFDFSHLAPLTPEQIKEVQDIVNREICHNHPVYDHQMPYREAMALGAIALFDEKYGEMVRVLSVGRPPISVELCGGTHVSATGELGFFQIVTEASIGAGLRRLEALTGREAAKTVGENRALILTLAQMLEAAPEGLLEKARALLDSRDQERHRAENFERELVFKDMSEFLGQVKEFGGLKVLAAHLKPTRPDLLRELADALRAKLGSAVVVLGTTSDDKPYFVVAVTPDLIAQGYHAGKIIREVAKATGGGGGGKPDLAQGGGKDASKLDEALALVPSLLKKYSKFN